MIDPRAARSYADAGIDERHADVDRIAAPAVNAGRDQCAHWLIPRHRRCRAREVANSSGENRAADQDQADARYPLHQSGPRQVERQRQRTIQGKAQEQAGEIEAWRPHYDARGCDITRLSIGKVHV